jgi:hypothetical protein
MPMEKSTKFKARIVAQGFTQKYGIDYQETYSPVANLTTFHLMFVIAKKRGWLVEQADVRTVYLNGTLEEEIFMDIPPGFPYHGEPNKV